MILDKRPRPCAVCTLTIEREHRRGWHNGRLVHAECLPDREPIAPSPISPIFATRKETT